MNIPSPEVLQQHGLTSEEYRRILELLGRPPNDVELGLFGVMWSEHCSYKSSRIYLKRFPTEGPRVLQGPGENAGVVEIGEGWAVAFKMESHNHPSFIEPYQGAATGVGGILRDIFTMGARPIALLDSLRFGDPLHPRTRYLVDGVVSGIAGYGNCVGIPTVGGELVFDPIYQNNILVNVMAVGLVRVDRIYRASARRPGDRLIYVGASTGRDGIHGATMASESFGEGGEERRPTVQVGDPFTEKRLMEACLEVMERGWIQAVQDMGAAGLTNASCEMAQRGGVGVELHLDRVPRREPGMTPYEVMLSESQERMLLVVAPDQVPQVLETFRRWELEAVEVGHLTDDGLLRVLDQGKEVARVPISALTRDAPVYQRPEQPPAYLETVRLLNLGQIPRFKRWAPILLHLLGSPNACSRQWVWRQYDHQVQVHTVVGPGEGAAVLRIKGSSLGLALTADGCGRYTFLDPYQGARLTVAEAARNLVVTGAQPLALTDCLNFGSPENPEVMWQFHQVVEGLADACRRLGIPVVSGNVSFYNETRGIPIYPTPIVGMVGLLEDVSRVVRPGFQQEGDRILLLGWTRMDLGGSLYLQELHHQVRGEPPGLDLDLEARVQRMCLEAIRRGWVRSAQDVSEGGLALALAEAILLSPRGLGARVAVQPAVLSGGESLREDGLLFGETPSRILLSVAPEHQPSLEALAREHQVPLFEMGQVGGDRLIVQIQGQASPLLDVGVEEMRKVWEQGLSLLLEGRDEG